MDHNRIVSKSQADIHIQSKIDVFFDRLKLALYFTDVVFVNVTDTVFAL